MPRGGPSAPAYVLTECLFQRHSWYQPFMWLICQASLHGDKVFVLQLEDRLFWFRSNDAASEKMLPRRPVSEGEQPRTGSSSFFLVYFKQTVACLGRKLTKEQLACRSSGSANAWPFAPEPRLVVCVVVSC